MATAVMEDWGLSAEIQFEQTASKMMKNWASNSSTPKTPMIYSPPLNYNLSSKSIITPRIELHTIREKEETSDNDDDDDDEEEEEDEEPDLTEADKSLMKKILRTHLLESSYEIEVERRNKAPLCSVKSFEQLLLPKELLRGVFAMGFNSPSKIQETTLPTLLANPPANLIAQSQNGTGKTAAFLLASLSRVNVEEEFPQVLILLPTYELALQIGEVAKKMAKFCDKIQFRFAVKGERLSRGHSINEQIVIGTPGKVFDWARRFKYFDLEKIRVFVLDEADVMIATQGHQDQCIRIHKLLSPDCQMLLFSATYAQEVMEFAEQIIREPIIIRLRRDEETLDNVKQYYVVCRSAEEKYTALCNIYGCLSVGQTIIFCHTKKTACWLGAQLTQNGHSVGYLSGDLDVSQRIAVLTRFREGKEKVLITTNVCSRGIDIEQVTIIINYDLPKDVQGRAACETYLHRIGRSGRFGRTGIAVSMVCSQADMKILKTIEEHFRKKIQKIDAQDVDDLESMNGSV